jgi:hypothetical protein
VLVLPLVSMAAVCRPSGSKSITEPSLKVREKPPSSVRIRVEKSPAGLSKSVPAVKLV